MAELDITPIGGTAGGDLGGSFPNPKLAAYRTIARGYSRALAATITGAGTYSAVFGATVQGLTASNNNLAILYLQPTDWAATGYSTKLRLLVGCLVTDTAPAITFTWGLYPISAFTGAGQVSTPTLGTVTSGSTVAFATPAANSLTAETSSGDFTFPSAGYYLIGIAADGAAATNSNPSFPWALQVRNV